MNDFALPVTQHALAREAIEGCTVQPVILAGGSGTRLWPLSREQSPKQLISLFGDESLLESTVYRLERLFAGERKSQGAPCFERAAPIVVCGGDLQLATLERLKRCGGTPRVLVEPSPRNTAPALTLAALAAQADLPDGPDPVLIVVPADHLIADNEAFVAALAQAVLHAAQGAIVTLGVPPERPETGYGYIRIGAPLGLQGECAIDGFVEKRIRNWPGAMSRAASTGGTAACSWCAPRSGSPPLNCCRPLPSRRLARTSFANMRRWMATARTPSRRARPSPPVRPTQSTMQ
jgi:mannose-1-phosphate guanylyltransferase/mannose-6-phosphate isomerase